VALVNSISYGWSELDQCSINPDECRQLGVDSLGYVRRVNAEFAKIALRGVTLLSASGDARSRIAVSKNVHFVPGDSGVHGRYVAVVSLWCLLCYLKT